MTRGPQVAILGGGITGLACAFELASPARDGDETCAVTVFEAASRPGGNLRTERSDGFTIEWGPNGFLDSEPATLALIDRLDLRDALQRSEDAARHRFLWTAGRLQEIPTTPLAFLRTRLLSPAAKLRVAVEPFVARRRTDANPAADPAADETVYAFGSRRLGRAFAETFLDPMVKGISGGDARHLSLAAAFPRMVELEDRYGSLFRALFAIGRERRRGRRRSQKNQESERSGERASHRPTPGPGGVLHSFHGGIAVLPERLAARLGERLLTSRPVESVKRDDHGWWIDAAGRSWGPFDAVIDATPAHAAAHHQPDPEVRRRLAEIRFAPLTVVAVAYPRAAVPHPLDGFGLLIPSREQRRLLGVLWTSSIFSGRAPAGQVLLRCMFGGGKALERTDDELLARLATELREILGVASRPSRRWIFRHPRGIAQYEPGHLARLRGLEDRLAATPGLFLAGSSYRGISINLCVRDAERTARTVRKFLRGAGRPPRVT